MFLWHRPTATTGQVLNENKTRRDAISEIDALRVRKYFRRYGSWRELYDTAMDTFSTTKRKAERLIADFLKLDLIGKCEFQHEKRR